MNYDEWMSEIDALFDRMCGLSHSDFPDWNWYDAHNDGSSPEQAFETWAEEEGFNVAQ